jgi:hypothetical protein
MLPWQLKGMAKYMRMAARCRGVGNVDCNRLRTPSFSGNMEAEWGHLKFSTFVPPLP